MLELSHAFEDCTGRWQRLEGDGPLTWRCTGCGVTYTDAVAVRFAVLREYDMELMVSRLVREGRRLLARPAGSEPADGAAPREEEP